MHTKNQISLTSKTLYGIMLLELFFSAFGAGSLPSARAQTDLCNNGWSQKTSLDGVNLQLCLPFNSDHSSVAEQNDWVQSGVWIKVTPHQEFSIYAIPYGVTPAVDNLPTATPGVIDLYKKATADLYGPDTILLIEGPSISIFGDSVAGATYLIPDRNSSSPDSQKLVTEWIVEAGNRVWMVYSYLYGDFSDESIRQAALESLNTTTIESQSLENPSTSLNAHQNTPTMPPAGEDMQAQGDLPSPSWWNGDCDVNNFPGSYPLGGIYRGVKACGPLNTSRSVSFGAGYNQLEWQCAELPKRYLYLLYGIAPKLANGIDVVNVYDNAASNLRKVTNGTPNSGLAAGDIISYNGPGTAGHTAIVSSVSIDGNGNGSYSTIEQNSSAGGVRTNTISNWWLNSNSGISVYLHDSSGSGSAPSAPSNMQQTSATQTSVTFSWIDNSSNESGFYVYKHNGSTWVNIHTAGANSTNYTDSSLNCGTTYFYDVSAYNSYGESNGANPYLTATTSSCGSAPTTPSSPNPSDGQTLGRTTNISLSWSTTGTSCDVSISGGPGTNVNQNGVSCSSFSFGQQWPGSYQWHVTAHNSYGTTGSSTWHFYIQPYAPSSLNASAASQTQINLSWTKSGDDPGSVDSYNVYNNNGSLITNVGVGSTSYQVGTLTCNTNYSFYVKAVRQGVESTASNTASTTTSICGSAPTTPSSPNPSDGQTLGRTTNIALSWNTTGTSCDVSISGGPGTNINQNGVSCYSFSFGQQWPGSYQWHITAHNSFGTTTGPTWHFNIQPYAPTSLIAAAATQTQINLSWIKSSDDPGSVDSYNVYYSNGSLITNVGAGSTSYQIGGLTCNTNHSFYVKAVRQGVESTASNTASATLSGCPPAAPTNFVINGATASSLTLNWQDNSNNESGFRIYRWQWDETQGANAFLYLATVSANITSYTQTDLSCESDFNYYELSAYNGNGESQLVGWIQGTTSACPIPVAPSNLVAIGGSQPNLTWTNSYTGYYHFHIERSLDSSTWEELPSTSYPAYTDTQAECSTLYYYRVRTHDYTFDTFSDYSNVASATTTSCTVPSNDDFNSSTLIGTIPYNISQDTRGATIAVDDPELTTCNRLAGQASVWYRYSPVTTGKFQIDTRGSNYDTMLALWRGARGSLIPIGCNDDIGTVNGVWDPDSTLILSLSAGTTYYIEASTFNGYIDVNGLEALSQSVKPIPEVTSLSGGLLNLHISKSYQIFLPLLFR